MQMYDKNTLQRIIRWLNNLIGGDFEIRVSFPLWLVKRYVFFLGKDKVAGSILSLHTEPASVKHLLHVGKFLLDVFTGNEPGAYYGGPVFPCRVPHRDAGEKEEVRRVDVEPGLLPLLAIQYLFYQMVEPHEMVRDHV